ncbi:MAG: hypothetical protein J0I32_04945 [Sphingobacteriales bacterium]|nr:hypothetical protein [Sphingobacteriales bacterium]OJV98507.1 MAG: hypothetical protein BGO52_12040 [Sphingobacteriales bacterium 44-61]
MSIQQSNLAQSKYGYDTVVAITQKALNNAIETYYTDAKKPDTLQPIFTPVSLYYVKDSSGNPVAIAKADLLKLTGNADPLSLNLSAAQIKTISSSAFYFAYNFTIGNPTGDGTISYITLHPGSDTVSYSLLCKNLQVAFWNPDKSSWVSIKQTLLQEFNLKATVKVKTILDNTNLSPAVQAAVDSLGDTVVDVQKLIFDLDSAAIDLTSTLTSLDSTCSVFAPMMQQFASDYFSTYASQNSGALNYAVTQKNSASLAPTGLEWYIGAPVDAYGNPILKNETVVLKGGVPMIVFTPETMDQQDLSTLNYLFSVNGNALPAAAQFNWNWLEDNGTSHNPDVDTNADINKFAGAISIKRDAFARYLQSQLDSYVARNLWVPSIYTGTSGYDDEFGIEFAQAPMPQNVFQPFNAATIATTGYDELLRYSYDYNSGNVAGYYADGDYMNVVCSFYLSVRIDRDKAMPAPYQTLIIDQGITFAIQSQMTAEDYGTQFYQGSPVSKTFTDVFTILAGDDGAISFANSKTSHYDFSSPIDLPGNVIGQINEYIQGLTAGNFTQVPVTLPKQFVFPGGNAFLFKDTQFSNNSDLVCHISYAATS